MDLFLLHLISNTIVHELIKLVFLANIPFFLQAPRCKTSVCAVSFNNSFFGIFIMKVYIKNDYQERERKNNVTVYTKSNSSHIGRCHNLSYPNKPRQQTQQHSILSQKTFQIGEDSHKFHFYLKF